jgi:cellobiose-specific phosphotransferase system component IIA
MKIDINEIKKYDYSDTSTARELIYKLTEELKKAYKLQDDLIKAITKRGEK